ncbi:MAG: methyltransferase domain-containing protein [Anaerolineales bacterium]|nr:methyltransferase domain-containing protein [Anaerolineales bacterium]
MFVYARALACFRCTRYNPACSQKSLRSFATCAQWRSRVDEYLSANRAWWDEATSIHARSPMYDVVGFKAGRSTLTAIERAELGDLASKSVLHLQCHFGLDTLSLARLGAQVTGADFSTQAIELARSLSAELDIPARFVCANVYDLPGVLSGQFDVVFTSQGVLPWLPDLTRWAQVIAHFLRPGGTFYILEVHPFGATLDDDAAATRLEVCYPYFHSAKPARFEGEGSYADRDARFEHTVTYEWVHSMGDVINALIGAGLHIQFLHEFPYCFYQMTPYLVQDDAGWWRLPGNDESVPLMFSLRATKRDCDS